MSPGSRGEALTSNVWLFGDGTSRVVVNFRRGQRGGP